MPDRKPRRRVPESEPDTRSTQKGEVETRSPLRQTGEDRAPAPKKREALAGEARATRKRPELESVARSAKVRPEFERGTRSAKVRPEFDVEARATKRRPAREGVTRSAKVDVEAHAPKKRPAREGEATSAKKRVLSVETRPTKKKPAAGAPSRKRRHPKKKTVAILSRKRSLYSTRRLVEAIKQQGHRPLVLDTLRCTMVLAKDDPRMLYRGVEVRDIDVVIPRIGASITAYGLAVVNHFDMMGVPVLNNSTPIARSRDKLRCLQLVSRFGIDIPRTVMANDRSNVPKLVEEVGGLPVIIKLIRGTQGVGVMIAHTLTEAETILHTFGELGQEILLQQFVAESKGRDIRALVVGDRVVGAMRRQAKQGEFRSNIHRGGEGTPLELPRAWQEAAVKAAHIVGLELAGVDMLETENGPRLMEINSSPGFEGLEAATHKDIAGEIVAHALAFAGAQRSGWSKRRLI